eukprot:2925399-Pleurochrysis_carterae.AAC.2
MTKSASRHRRVADELGRFTLINETARQPLPSSIESQFLGINCARGRIRGKRRCSRSHWSRSGHDLASACESLTRDCG